MDGKKVIGLIPARSGSKRVQGKNILQLAGHPLMAYTISAALESGVFDSIVISTDSEEYAGIAKRYGAEVPFLRPAGLSGDVSPDIEWVEHALITLKSAGREYDAFSILRPTSPFRLPETIRRAWSEFLANPEADSLRAVEKCKQHPGKMWLLKGIFMRPLFDDAVKEEIFGISGSATPWHSSQYQSLPEVYVQNASLEIAWTRVVFSDHSIAGGKIVPFLTTGYEGFDVNHPYDWELAERLVAEGKARLPDVKK